MISFLNSMSIISTHPVGHCKYNVFFIYQLYLYVSIFWAEQRQTYKDIYWWCAYNDNYGTITFIQWYLFQLFVGLFIKLLRFSFQYVVVKYTQYITNEKSTSFTKLIAISLQCSYLNTSLNQLRYFMVIVQSNPTEE